MPRPPTEVGTYGEINKTEVAPGNAFAETYFRMPTGKLKRVRRYGKSKTEATTRLKQRLLTLAEEAFAGAVSPDTRMEVVADLWLAECAIHVANKTLARASLRQYRGYVKNWVKPTLGELLAREAERLPMSFNTLILRAQTERSYDAAKSLRAVLSGICQFAVRNGAMMTNPVASTGRLRRGKGEQKKIVALTAAQRRDLKAKLTALGEAKRTNSRGHSIGVRARVWLQLPDFQDAMLASGARIGELTALDGDDVVVKDGKVRILIRHHIDRFPGEGLVRVPGRKFGEDELELLVPDWSAPMWRRLKLAAGPGPLFPSSKGGWLDPSNAVHRLREAFDLCGYEWITSHVWRKTVSDVLNEAGLSSTAIADQLGNTVAVVERHYRNRRKANPETAAALEGMWGEPETGS
jgi:integrase